MSLITVYPSITASVATSGPTLVVLMYGADALDTSGLKEIESTAETAEQALLSLLGYASVTPGNLPGALCRQRGHGLEPTGSRQVCADPVHLQPDRDTARSSDGHLLAIADDDAAALIAAINDLLEDDGLTLQSGDAHRWYLSGMDATALDTAPTTYVAGRPLDAFVPLAQAAAGWRRLTSEMQMLLHAHPVNRQRGDRGLPAINGIWFWGGAPLPARETAPRVAVLADDPFARGACRSAGFDALPLATLDAGGHSTLPATEPDAIDTIIVVDAVSGSDDTAAAVSQRLASARAWLDAGHVFRVVIDVGDGRAYELPGRQRSVWARLRDTLVRA